MTGAATNSTSHAISIPGLPSFYASLTAPNSMLYYLEAKKCTTTIRLSLTSFPKTNESLGKGQSRTTKAFVFTFTEKKMGYDFISR